MELAASMRPRSTSASLDSTMRATNGAAEMMRGNTAAGHAEGGAHDGARHGDDEEQEDDERQRTRHVDEPAEGGVGDAVGTQAVRTKHREERAQDDADDIGAERRCEHHDHGVDGALREKLAILVEECGQLH